jgi:glucose-1-phosphate thymidylyltransferase
MNRNKHLKPTANQQVIGVIPMAGRAARLAGLPCSKEIYPIGPRTADDAGQQPRVVCEYLLRKMRTAGVSSIYVILRDGKWDIPAYLGDGSKAGLQLAYLMMGLPYGTPYSVDQSFPFVRQATVALGFPDMIFGPEDVFTTLLEHQQWSGADVVLGLFPADRPGKVDMVELDDDGNVMHIIIKPRHTDLNDTWGVAVWAPTFTGFMHEFLALHQKTAAGKPELFVGDVVQAAIKNGLRVRGVRVSEQPFLDIGTWDDLSRAKSLPLDK